MARYAYDVNTTQRYIDVHKQFQGGLKTVDTDDALGAVFLREAENISLSEFGFLEKRYGTYENFKAALSVTDSSILQGYWEFMGKYIVVALNGRIHFQLLSAPETLFTTVDTLYKVAGLKYPEDIAQHLLATVETDAYIGGIDSFQNTRPMGAVNVANVLYIFTGKYPIYLVEEDNTLKAYLFSIEDPTFAELTVTGHNLLENDYDTLYYGPVEPVETISILEDSEKEFVIKDDAFSPKLPFAKDGTLEFNFSYDYETNLANEFVIDTENQTPTLLNELVLKKVQARPSGPGATDLSYVDFDLNDIEYNELNNVTDALDTDTNLLTPPLENFTNVNINSTLTTPNLSVTTLGPITVNQKYWASDVAIAGIVADANLQIEDTEIPLFTAEAKDIEVTVDFFPQEYLEEGRTFSFAIKKDNQVVELEPKINTARPQLNSFKGTDTRNKSFYTKVNQISQREYQYVLYYKVENPNSDFDSVLPIFFYQSLFDDFYPEIADARIEYAFTGTTFNNIQVKLYRPDGVLFQTTLVKYDDEDGVERTLLYSDLTANTPTLGSNFNELVNLVNRGTVVELYSHSSNTAPGVLLGAFKLGVGDLLSYQNGYYQFQIPADVIDQSANHYSWKFKSVDINIDDTNQQSAFFNQEPDDSSFFLESTQLSGYFIKYLYPNIPKYIQVSSQNYVGIHQNTSLYNVYEVLTVVDLQQKDALGSDILYARISNALLSGTYDFRFEYELQKVQFDYNTLRPSEFKEIETVSYIVKDITVTEEKLTDYTFFQGDRAHPIWSCNGVLEHFGKLMVYGSEEMPTALFYSFPDRPFYFPSFFYLDFTNEENKPIVSVTPFMNILVVQTEDQTWGVRGNSGLITAPSPYAEFGINNTVGTIAPKSVRPVRNHLFFLSKQGVIALKSLYAADEQYNIDFVDRNIRNIVPQDKDAVGVQFDNQYWLNFPNFGITLRWYIDKKAWVKDTYSAWNNFNGVFKYQVKDGKLEFITLPSRFEDEGNSNIYKVGVDYTLPTDLGGIVSTKFETSFLNQNYPFHPKNYKEAKFDFTLQNEYNISRDTVYEMDFAEHIVDGTTHTIDNVNLTKNHRYRIVYNFSDHNIDEDIVSGGDFTGANIPTDVVEGGSFTTAPTILFGALSFSILGAQDLQIESVQIQDNEGDIKDVDFNIYSDDTYDYYVDFLLPNSVDGIVDIIVTGEFSSYNDGAIMYDITYDSNLVFYNWVISEDRTLNLDNIESYDQSKAELNVDFNGRLGNWVFGSSDFGNKVTAVKTEKLSGRGYNAKVYVEDFSRSKWTLESLGLTYKMKRARSR